MHTHEVSTSKRQIEFEMSSFTYFKHRTRHPKLTKGSRDHGDTQFGGCVSSPGLGVPKVVKFDLL